MSESSGIHKLSGTRPGAPPRPVPKEAARIRDTVSAGLGDLLQGALDAVDDSLFELANNSRSNNEQSRYFEAMREIRIKRKGIERRFLQTVTDLFARPPRLDQLPRPQGAGKASTDDLTLVGHEELEEQVALNAMISKADAHFQGPLIQLQARFTELYPDASDDKPVNPLAPAALCKAFAEATDTLEIDIRERLVVLKQFDRYVISNLGMLLDEANRVLIQAGIIPDFRYRGQTTPKRATPQASQPMPAGESGSTPSAGDESTALFEQIRHLLALRRPNDQHTSTQPPPSEHVVSTGELEQLVAGLATPGPATATEAGDLSAGEPVVLDLYRVVERLLARQPAQDGQPAALSGADEDLINLVSMLFEFILDDKNLSAPVQVLISRLQIPILKVVIKDKSFFAKPGHPARKLLNTLASAGIGWSHSDEKARDKLYKQIHTTVQRILEEFDGDVSLFETLNQDFEQFLEREERKAALVEQRTRESERGRIKSRKAQEEVDRLLKEKTRASRLPEPVQDLLVNGWSRVMFLAYLRNDTEHRWPETVQVVDDLIWCLNPHRDPEERDQWVRLVPPLLKTLRAGLQGVSYRSGQLDAIMSSLKNQLAEAFRNPDQAPVATTGPAPDDDSTTESPATELTDAAVAEHLAQIDSLQIGDWVEFRLVNGTSFRCKLSAVIEEANCCVFVNRMGLKVIEKSRTDLANELRQGRLSLIDRGALIDRAMGAVVGSLKTRTA
ncbi:MAG: DUF1631 domain-containing protein [Alteromonadaceae bacterium]|nr:DUF1631 domain-containing protein [Alteromonadaceae bacterium]